MLLTPQSRKNLLPLRALVKGCSEESTRLRKNKINKLAKEEKHSAQLEKVHLGIHTRHYQLAYGFLRGLDYKQLERNTKSRPVPNYVTMPSCVEWISTHVLHQIMLIHSPTIAAYIKPEDLEQWILTGKRFFLTWEQAEAKLEYEKKKIGLWVPA